MRAVYLVRHGQPELPEGARLCVGRVNLPLSRSGQAQARLLGGYFAGLPARVVSSPLDRCRRTAEAISDRYEVCDGLLEIDMGEWTGLSFEDIRTRWPELYGRRGREPGTTAPPGGESFEQCGRRAASAFWEILRVNPGGTLVLSTHSGVIRALCASLTEKRASELPAPPCGSVTQLLAGAGEAYLGRYGALPGDLPGAVPDERECQELMESLGTPEHVREHCRAVAELTSELCREINGRGGELNEGLARCGALLHDIARVHPRHDLFGARWLCEMGCAAVGAVVGNHMSLGGESAERWSESAVVFLADKLVRGTQRVSLEERFFSEPDPGKMPYIQERYGLARSLLRRLREGETDGDGF